MSKDGAEAKIIALREKMETPAHGEHSDGEDCAEAEPQSGDGGHEDAPNSIDASYAEPVVHAHRSSHNETIAPPGGPLSRADAVKKRGRELEERIGKERQDMELSVQQLQADFRKHFQRAFLGMEQQTLSHFAPLEVQQVAGEERKIRECDADFKKLAHTTAPEIMEKLQGTITRKLDKNLETLDIENAKIRKREKKTLGALESNERKTEADFCVERERCVAKFQERKEEFHHVMRIDNRDSERKQCNQIETLASLRHQLHEKTKVREKEDLAILDKLASSFHQLQSSILESLGEEQS